MCAVAVPLSRPDSMFSSSLLPPLAPSGAFFLPGAFSGVENQMRWERPLLRKVGIETQMLPWASRKEEQVYRFLPGEPIVVGPVILGT